MIVDPMSSQGPAARPGRDRVGAILTSLRLFLSAYTPLFTILAIKSWGSPLSWAFIALAVLGIAETIALLAYGSKAGTHTIDVVEVKEAGSEIAAYVATYILPFVWGDVTTFQDGLATAIFLIVILIIGHKAHLHHINPTLYVAGRSVVSVTTPRGTNFYLVCKDTPRPGRLEVSAIHGLYFLKRGQ